MSYITQPHLRTNYSDQYAEYAATETYEYTEYAGTETYEYTKYAGTEIYEYTEYPGTEIYEYKENDNVDVDLIEVEPIDDGGIGSSKNKSENSLLADLSPIQQQQFKEQQMFILQQLQNKDQSEFEEYDNYSNDTSSSNSSHYVDDAKPTLSPKSSVKFGKFVTFGGNLKEKLNRPRISKQIRMLNEMKIPAPGINEPILLESFVQKLVSSASKKSSNNLYLVLTKKCLCSFKSSQKSAKILVDTPPIINTHDSNDDYYPPKAAKLLGTNEHNDDNLPPKAAKILGATHPTANDGNDDYYPQKAAKILGITHPIVNGSSDDNPLKDFHTLIPSENVVLSLATVYAVSISEHQNPRIRIDYIPGPRNHDYVSILSLDYKHWLAVMRPAIHATNPVGSYLTFSQRKRLMGKLRTLKDLANENEENLFAFRVLLQTIIDRDTVKESNVPIFFVLGRNNIYLIPFNLAGNDLSPDDDDDDPKIKKQSLHYPLLFESVKPKEIELRRFQYPLLCLTKIYSDGNDDTFQLTFRNSTGTVERTLKLASIMGENIITEIRTAIDSITFWWPCPGYELKAPASMQATIVPPERESDKTSHAIGFDRMIEAQCHANRVVRSRISFNIEYVLGSENVMLGLEVDNLPFRFILLPPESKSSQLGKDDSNYSNQELIAIFNSLKYHPLLHEIILRDINLFELQIQSGPKDHKGKNMLAAVLYDLLLSNPRLRKLDLTSCGITSETVSAIGEAFMTGQSCLESLLLGDNSIMREEGVQALASGITGHKSSIKELDISNCKLTQESIESILHALDTNNLDKLEVLNISNNACDLESDILSELLSKAVSLRTLNLCNCPKLFDYATSVISTEVLGNTLLTTLNIGGIPLNDEHVDSLYAYIQSPAFAKVRFFNVSHCNLDGDMIAIILSFITISPNCKKIRVWAGGNHLARTPQSYKEFCNAIRNDWTPTWLSLKDTVFGSDPEIITEILQSFCENSVIKYLDLSYPIFDAGKEAPFNPLTLKIASKACEIIGNIFKQNHSIREIELVGSLERRFGSSLGASLYELSKNDTLEKLNVKGNAMGSQGAKSLSEALKSNTKLRVLNCDDNEIGIEGYEAIRYVLTTGINKAVKQFAYPTQDIETYDETLDTKLSATSREGLFNPKLSQKIASEKQKIRFRKTIDDIMEAVERIESSEHFNGDSFRSISSTKEN